MADGIVQLLCETEGLRVKESVSPETALCHGACQSQLRRKPTADHDVVTATTTLLECLLARR